MFRLVPLAAIAITFGFGSSNLMAEEATPIPENAVRVIVMDPLSAPLSCPCVEGYAQRKYEVLTSHLAKTLDRPVNLVFAESLQKGLKESGGTAHLIIGKHSVVRHDAAAVGVSVTHIGRLTDQAGQTTQHGLIVAEKDDPATSVTDLEGYTVIFGPAEADEKHAAAVKLLKSNGIAVPETKTIDKACSDGACKIVKLGADGKTVAVISSYAAPLLEGCGTVKKGDLKVIGQTEPVPFVAAFVTESLDAKTADAVTKTLLTLVDHPEVCEAIESLIGFLPPETDDVDPSEVSARSKKKPIR